MHAPSESRDALRIEVHYAPLTCIAAAAAFLVVSAWGGYWLAAGLFSGHWLALLMAAVVLLVLMPVLLAFLPAVIHPWRHRGPVLILDETGVTDLRKKVSFIPWSDIASIGLGSGETAAFLCFAFKRTDRSREDPPRIGPLGKLTTRVRFLSAWNVSLRMLRCDRHELLAAARRLRQISIRQQIVALNANSKAGPIGGS